MLSGIFAATFFMVNICFTLEHEISWVVRLVIGDSETSQAAAAANAVPNVELKHNTDSNWNVRVAVQVTILPSASEFTFSVNTTFTRNVKQTLYFDSDNYFLTCKNLSSSPVWAIYCTTDSTSAPRLGFSTHDQHKEWRHFLAIHGQCSISHL